MKAIIIKMIIDSVIDIATIAFFFLDIFVSPQIPICRAVDYPIKSIIPQ